MAGLMLVVYLATNVAYAIQEEDPLYNFAQGIVEIVQINLSIWRILYVIIEIFALMFVFIILPAIIFKLMKWAIREVFGGK